MAFSFDTAKAHINHALGGDPNENVEVYEIVNAAGQHLVNMHPWRWLEDSVAYLDLRANVTVTGLDWDESSNTLTAATTAFTDYVFVPGDTFEVTGGAGAYLGYYRITSATDSTLILDREITTQSTPQGEWQSFPGPDTTASDLTDLVSGVVHAEGVALPYDLAEVTAYNATSGLLKGLQMTSHADILQRRASTMATPGYYYATIVQPAKLKGTVGENTRPYPRLELWPAPSVNENAALQIVYRRGWHGVSNPVDIIPIPEWTHSLFLECCRAFALGWEEADIATADQRLVLIAQGPLFSSAIARDAAIQPDLGITVGGAAEGTGNFSSFSNFNAVNEPHSNVP